MIAFFNLQHDNIGLDTKAQFSPLFCEKSIFIWKQKKNFSSTETFNLSDKEKKKLSIKNTRSNKNFIMLLFLFLLL